MHVRPSVLKGLAATVWLVVGIVLASVGVRFVFRDDPVLWNVALAFILGGGIGALKGQYVLTRTAKRNIRRIEALPSPRIYQAFSGKFYLLIVLMMGLGQLLRFLAARDYLGGYLGVGGLYFGIGAALAVSSLAYFRKPPPPMRTRLDVEPSPRKRKSGVLLVNLGTPQAPTTGAVRRYLRQFLGDPRVVEANRLVWAFVLNVIILPFRSSKSAALYQSIWTERGSPLLDYSRRTEKALAARFGDDVEVSLSMRYGEPSIEQGLDDLIARGCEPILVVPMFPQYSNTTTGSVVAEVARVATSRRHQPTLQFQEPFFDHPLYIEALARLAEEGDPADLTVFSFHGIPESYTKKGDPYLDQCGRTAWLLAQRLGLARDEWEMVFQSRFGDEPWLQPYLDEYVIQKAETVKRIRVIAPAFTADCLETLEEIAVELKEDFLEAGGEALIVIPALNDEPSWIDALEQMVRERTRSGTLPALEQNC